MRLKAVVYDLDGTLVDSRGDLADSVNAMLEALGLARRQDEIIWSFIGEGAERLVRRSLGPRRDAPRRRLDGGHRDRPRRLGERLRRDLGPGDTGGALRRFARLSVRDARRGRGVAAQGMTRARLLVRRARAKARLPFRW